MSRTPNRNVIAAKLQIHVVVVFGPVNFSFQCQINGATATEPWAQSFYLKYGFSSNDVNKESFTSTGLDVCLAALQFIL